MEMLIKIIHSRIIRENTTDIINALVAPEMQQHKRTFNDNSSDLQKIQPFLIIIAFKFYYYKVYAK